MSGPIVLIVGKPNVGKSTLFNRMIGEKKSIVLDFPGVTRDHVYAEARFCERAFTVIDTCGIFENPTDIIQTQQKKAVLDSVKEADLVLFVVDGKNGLSSEDFHTAQFIRKAGVEVLLVANKAEGYDRYEDSIKPELYSLGLGEPIPVSAEHNKNLEELFEAIIERLEGKGYNLMCSTDEKNSGDIKVALIGRPNVGKSSLFNMLLGTEKAVVSDIPGTTRDPVDQRVRINDKNYLFIDTAGLRKKSIIEYGSIEMFSNVRTVKSIEKADVVAVLIDSTQGITVQDQKVAGLAEDRGKATVIVLNKWDAAPSELRDKKVLKKAIEKDLYFIDYSPVVMTSCLERTGSADLMAAIDKAYASYTRQIPTSALNAALERFLMVTPPPVRGGKRIKFTFVTQVGVKPPVFTFYVNTQEEVPKNYQQSLRNMIRNYIDPYPGSPLFLKFIYKEEKQLKSKNKSSRG
ncbi:MAG TPA: ribosome biogenesis GTPase Der [Petrotogaceae bacterium]|nr:ribosome biogenesis GTPase Der [Petrotogaceae bacterium]